ncbi:MAG: hypothetical protein JNK40_14310 [Chromatiales bacterium]|nr:hypothetical protein [Chromatiales bacterium]
MSNSGTVKGRRRSRRFLLGALAAALGTLVPLLLVEVALHFLPVTEPAYAQPVNARMPYLHFLPDRDVTWSSGWRFSIVTRKHVNNYGFTSDVDFVRDRASPLLTVIGDSYVEAWQVPNALTMHGLLAERLAGRGRVYGIGFSGSPLSQYLAYAELAHRDFAPDAMAFVIIGNDFDESLRKYKQQPGYHYFTEQDGELVLERIDYPGQSRAVALASRSRLAMYLRYTIGFDFRRVASRLRSLADAPTRFVGNVAADASAERIADSKAAIAAFLDQLPERSGLPPQRILFVLDAIRPELYTPADGARAEASYFGQMRRHFLTQARAGGFEVIDLAPAFAAAHALDGTRFEFPTDNHWNARGHAVVAGEIARSAVWSRTFR